MGWSRRVRVHAIVLTRNRTSLLERSVGAAVGSLQACDVVTVLDDSGQATMRRNVDLLQRMARGSSAMVTHVVPSEIYWGLDKRRPLGWTCRTGERDIAPLRNTALLLAAAMGARTNVFIDDDMADFNIEETHHCVEALRAEWPNVIVGAQVFGQSEMDTITKLEMAARRMRLRVGYGGTLDELLAVECGNHAGSVECDWVSAGYMAFNLEPSQYFAFPPGYNEDWLWCLLHGMTGKVRIIRSSQCVRHRPAEARIPADDEDLWFELRGDLVFDCLRSFRAPERRMPWESLKALETQRPSCELLPSTRVRELVEEIAQVGMDRQGERVLLECGLGVVRALAKDGYCERAERSVLRDWCEDARAKYGAYAALLADGAVREIVGAIVAERRI